MKGVYLMNPNHNPTEKKQHAVLNIADVRHVS